MAGRKASGLVGAQPVPNRRIAGRVQSIEEKFSTPSEWSTGMQDTSAYPTALSRDASFHNGLAGIRDHLETQFTTLTEHRQGPHAGIVNSLLDKARYHEAQSFLAHASGATKVQGGIETNNEANRKDAARAAVYHFGQSANALADIAKYLRSDVAYGEKDKPVVTETGELVHPATRPDLAGEEDPYIPGRYKSRFKAPSVLNALDTLHSGYKAHVAQTVSNKINITNDKPAESFLDVPSPDLKSDELSDSGKKTLEEARMPATYIEAVDRQNKVWAGKNKEAVSHHWRKNNPGVPEPWRDSPNGHNLMKKYAEDNGIDSAPALRALRRELGGVQRGQTYTLGGSKPFKDPASMPISSRLRTDDEFTSKIQQHWEAMHPLSRDKTKRINRYTLEEAPRNFADSDAARNPDAYAIKHGLTPPKLSPTADVESEMLGIRKPRIASTIPAIVGSKKLEDTFAYLRKFNLAGEDTIADYQKHAEVNPKDFKATRLKEIHQTIAEHHGTRMRALSDITPKFLSQDLDYDPTDIQSVESRGEEVANPPKKRSSAFSVGNGEGR